MTRMTGPDCVVMCNLINTYIHTYILPRVRRHRAICSKPQRSSERVLAWQVTMDQHTYIHTYINTYIHTYIHTYILPRVRRHRASKPQGSSKRVLPWQVTMDQLVCASLSHTHNRSEMGMLKVPADRVQRK